MDWEPILDFWFADLDSGGGLADQNRRWWRKDAAFDAEIRQRFAADHAAIEAGEREHWLDNPRGLLAYVVVLDQFSRNMFRDTPAMFASDPRALAAAKRAVAGGIDATLRPEMRLFLYMPFMHSESLADQDTCIELITRMTTDPAVTSYAERHRAVIARFGRFPHRNAILGRPSTPEELAFLAGPGARF